MAALSSYRHDTVLRPFPPMFVRENSDSKDYAKLVSNLLIFISVRAPSFLLPVSLVILVSKLTSTTSSTVLY